MMEFNNYEQLQKFVEKLKCQFSCLKIHLDDCRNGRICIGFTIHVILGDYTRTLECSVRCAKLFNLANVSFTKC